MRFVVQRKRNVELGLPASRSGSIFKVESEVIQCNIHLRGGADSLEGDRAFLIFVHKYFEERPKKCPSVMPYYK